MPSPESISHIRHDLLSRPVHTYADKLNAELRSIWQELGIKTMAEFDRLAQEKKIPEAVVRHYRDLAAQLADVVRSGKLPEDALESTLEQALTLTDGSKLIELDPDTRKEALYLLHDKLNEPDIKAFLESTPPEILQKDFILILRVPIFSDNTPVTMKTLNDRLQPDLTQRNQGKLLRKVNWYKDEPIFTTDSFSQGMHWQIVSKEVLPETLNKTHSEQSEILKTKAHNLHLDSSKTKRRTPLEVIYDTITHFRNTDTRLLEETYDWTDVKTSSGFLVHVGICDPGGAFLDYWVAGDRNGYLGVCLSR